VATPPSSAKGERMPPPLFYRGGKVQEHRLGRMNEFACSTVFSYARTRERMGFIFAVKCLGCFLICAKCLERVPDEAHLYLHA
jgi:hypothetical protein